MSNEDNEKSEYLHSADNILAFNADQVAMHQHRIALTTNDLILTRRLAVILPEFNVVHIKPHDQTYTKEPDIFYLFDVRGDARFFTKIDEPCLALTDSTEPAVLTDLFNIGFTDILPLSLLDLPKTVKHMIQMGIARKEALKGKAKITLSTPKHLLDFATLMLEACGSEDSVGQAAMEASRSLQAIAAAFFILEYNDLVLLTEYGHSQEALDNHSRISLQHPNPFGLSIGGHKSAWLNVGSMMTTDLGIAPNGIMGILPCCLDNKTLAVLKLVFADRKHLKASIKTAANVLSALTAQALENARKVQSLQNEAKFAAQLIGMASHDLRNPLNTLRLSTELLRLECEASGLATKSLPCMSRAIEQAVAIIDTLNEFTRVKLKGIIPIHPKSTSMTKILYGVLEDLKLQAPKRRFEFDSVGTFEGQWDEDRMRQVLYNLITNAHRYAPFEENIRITLDGRGDHVYITVKNALPIIPAARLHTLFEPMVQADKVSLTSKGLGLGLYIVHGIVSAHQGRVWVTSEKETGTVFTVELPRVAATNLGDKEKPMSTSTSDDSGNNTQLDALVQYPPGMQDHCCQVLYQLWVNMSGFRRLPHPANLPQKRIHGFLHDMCWVRIIERDGVTAYHFEQVGAALEQRLGRKLTGLEVTADEVDDDLTDFIAANHRSCVSGTPDFMYVKYYLGSPEPGRFEKLVLPFSRRLDGQVTDLISVVRFIGIKSAS